VGVLVIEYAPLAELFLSDLNPRQEVAEDGIELLAHPHIDALVWVIPPKINSV
jgi:hypothetical protein